MQPWHWLVLGLLLMMIELFVLSLTALWFGVAALATALVAWTLPIGLAVQIVLWLVLSIVCCVLWFRLIQPKIKNRTLSGLGGAVIIGEIGMIVQVSPVAQTGVVRFSVPKVGASEWVCRTLDGSPLSVGERVVVANVIGNELAVTKMTHREKVSL